MSEKSGEPKPLKLKLSSSKTQQNDLQAAATTNTSAKTTPSLSLKTSPQSATDTENTQPPKKVDTVPNTAHTHPQNLDTRTKPTTTSEVNDTRVSDVEKSTEAGPSILKLSSSKSQQQDIAHSTTSTPPPQNDDTASNTENPSPQNLDTGTKPTSSAEVNDARVCNAEESTKTAQSTPKPFSSKPKQNGIAHSTKSPQANTEVKPASIKTAPTATPPVAATSVPPVTATEPPTATSQQSTEAEQTPLPPTKQPAPQTNHRVNAKVEEPINSEDSPSEKNDRLSSILIVAAIFIILVAAATGIWFLLRSDPAQSTEKTTTEAVTARTAEQATEGDVQTAPTTAPSSPIARAKATIEKVPDRNLDDVIETSSATVPEGALVSETNAPPAENLKAAVSLYLQNVQISGVRTGTQARIMLNGVNYNIDDTVDTTTGLVFIGARDKRLIFKDRNGIVYVKSF
jgi:hypothetical protein